MAPRLGGVVGVGGQEDHARRVATGAGKVEAHRPGEEPVGYLDQDAGSVARGHLGPGGAPVGEVLESGDRLADQTVAAPALQVGHEGDAAGVVLEGGVVQGRAGVAPAQALKRQGTWLSSLGSLRDRSRGGGVLTLGTTLALLQPP